MKAILLLPFLSTGLLLADVGFDPIYASHMVIQQGKPVTVSGACSGKAPVTVTLGDQTVQAVVKNGKWQATLQPLEASAEGRTLTVTQGSDSATCEDVLVGEVWLASGQSNMLFRMDETRDTNGMAAANNATLRICRMEPQVHTAAKAYTDAEFTILENNGMFTGTWAVTSPESIRRMSAVGYYFGDELQKRLDVPVGVINVSLGGSEMMAWMPEKLLKKKYPDFAGDRYLKNAVMQKTWLLSRVKQNLAGSNKSIHPYQPGYLYRSGITPWENFPIAGVIWYQGESDAELNDSKFNGGQLRDLITSWRETFKNPALPFLMVQLPRINSSEPLRAYWPEFRQVQQSVADTMDGVESVCTIDLGSTDSNVHPIRKLEVGQRLAYVAANKVYGKSDVACEGPRITRIVPKGGRVTVHFDNAEGLATTDGTSPAGFEVSADGKKFIPAEATIEDGTVVLKAQGVKSPKHVRYAWATYLEPNLVNAAKLPAIPYNSTMAKAAKDGKGKKKK